MAHNIAITEVLKEVQDSDCSMSDWENSDIGNDTDDKLDPVPRESTIIDPLTLAQLSTWEHSEVDETVPEESVTAPSPISPPSPASQQASILVNNTTITTPVASTTLPPSPLTCVATPPGPGGHVASQPNTSTPLATTSHSATFTTPAAFTPPPFTEPVGPTNLLHSNASPLEFFNVIFGEQTYQYITDQTNLYARQNPPPPSLNWTDVCADEIKLFLGMTLIMGVHKLPELEDYWSGDALLGVPAIVGGMPFRRFKAIRHCLHLNDNTKAAKRGEPGYDKMHKVRPLMNIVNDNSLAEYHPHREISIDEAMIAFKGRSSIKQYMPMKPTKRGFKMWSSCDAYNGYVINHRPYLGSGDDTTQGGLGPSVVKAVAGSIMDKDHFLFYDNFFSSVELATDLLARKTYSIATTRVNRKQWPIPLRNTKALDKELARGEHRSIVQSGVECLVWKDKKCVSVINTICPPSSLTTVNRRNKDGSLSRVSCPMSVKLYNKYMGVWTWQI